MPGAMQPFLPIDEILTRPVPQDGELVARGSESIGSSREGREILGARVGGGPLHVSLIGGCHADEPVGPETLARLLAFLLSLPTGHPLIRDLTWSVVPHVNPDGRERNRVWSESRLDAADSTGRANFVFDLPAYLRGAVRELPGDDIEFGFPATPADDGARIENQAVARFLRPSAPFHLHGSFHGMGFAPGPWFLLEPSWIDRTTPLRKSLRRQVRQMGLVPFDIDRGGEKGFHRIDEGFSTRPDSEAMKNYFRQRRDRETAARFRPSSMEYVRSLGGDPLTFVTEMPLFLLPAEKANIAIAKTAPGSLRDRLQSMAAGSSDRAVRTEASRMGIRPMPIGDQARLQLAFLDQALQAAVHG